jgi:hypothetical protein
VLSVAALSFNSPKTYAQTQNLPAYAPVRPNVEEEASHWRPGIQGGMAGTTYSKNPDVGGSSRVGFIVGFELEYRVSPTFFLQQELRVVQKGFSYDLKSGNSVTNYDARIAYLEVPLLAKVKLLPDAVIQPFFFAGPNLGVNIGSNVDVSSGGVPVTGPALQVLFHTLDFAIDSGVGAEYHFARRMAGFFELRASIGLVNVSELAGTDWKSRSYQAIFGGLFDF